MNLTPPTSATPNPARITTTDPEQSQGRQAHQAGRATAIGTAKAFSAPGALSALILPPAARSLALAPSAVMWTQSQDKLFSPSVTNKGVFTDDLLKYTAFIPFLGLQTAMTAPHTSTGKRLAELGKAWQNLCEKIPLLKGDGSTGPGNQLKQAVKAYPVGPVGTRVMAQLASGYVGGVLAHQYGSEACRANAPQAAGQEQAGKPGHEDDRRLLRFAPSALFTFPMLAFSPAGRAAIARKLGLSPTGKFTAVATDMVATTTLVGAAVGANSIRRSNGFQRLETARP